MSIEKYHGYHGTSKVNGDRIITQNIKIPSGITSGNYKNEPGNFGYGFYMFLEDLELARGFAERHNRRGKISILEIFCSVEDEKILDFRPSELQEKLLFFYKANQKSIENHLKNFGKISNELTLLVTGITIELFIGQINRKMKTQINMVIGESFTQTAGYSRRLTIPNGVEISIRNVQIIDSVKLLPQ